MEEEYVTHSLCNLIQYHDFTTHSPRTIYPFWIFPWASDLYVHLSARHLHGETHRHPKFNLLNISSQVYSYSCIIPPSTDIQFRKHNHLSLLPSPTKPTTSNHQVLVILPIKCEFLPFSSWLLLFLFRSSYLTLTIGMVSCYACLHSCPHWKPFKPIPSIFFVGIDKVILKCV